MSEVETLTQSMTETVRERIKYKDLYEQISDEKEQVASDLQKVHRELQLARAELQHERRVTQLQHKLIAVLEHHSTRHWPTPDSPQAPETVPF